MFRVESFLSDKFLGFHGEKTSDAIYRSGGKIQKAISECVCVRIPAILMVLFIF